MGSAMVGSASRKGGVGVSGCAGTRKAGSTHATGMLSCLI